MEADGSSTLRNSPQLVNRKLKRIGDLVSIAQCGSLASF